MSHISEKSSQTNNFNAKFTESSKESVASYTDQLNGARSNSFELFDGTMESPDKEEIDRPNSFKVYTAYLPICCCLFLKAPGFIMLSI